MYEYVYRVENQHLNVDVSIKEFMNDEKRYSQQILDICLPIQKAECLYHTTMDRNNGKLWIRKDDLELLRKSIKEDLETSSTRVKNEYILAEDKKQCTEILDIITKSDHIDDAIDILYKNSSLFQDRYKKYIIPEAPEWMLKKYPKIKDELDKIKQVYY